MVRVFIKGGVWKNSEDEIGAGGVSVQVEEWIKNDSCEQLSCRRRGEKNDG